RYVLFMHSLKKSNILFFNFTGSGYECLLSVVYAQTYQIKRLSFLSSGANLRPDVLFDFANFSSFHGQYQAENPLPYGGIQFYEPIDATQNSTTTLPRITISVISQTRYVRIWLSFLLFVTQ